MLQVFLFFSPPVLVYAQENTPRVMRGLVQHGLAHKNYNNREHADPMPWTLSGKVCSKP